MGTLDGLVDCYVETEIVGVDNQTALCVPGICVWLTAILI